MYSKLEQYGFVKISGADALKFLQGQLSCDIDSLKVQQSTLGAYCSIKGKVFSLFRIWRSPDAYYIRLQKQCVTATISELKKYAIFSKVLIEDVSEQLSGIGVDHLQIDHATVPANIFIFPITAQRYEVYGSDDNLIDFRQIHLSEHTESDANAWELLEIQDMLPEVYAATIDQFFAHDLNLQNLNAVSFTKGCFRGQEIVARMQHRGNLKRHLHKFEVDAVLNLQPGEAIHSNDNPTGIIVRSAVTANSKTVGLAVITDSCLQTSMVLHNHPIRIL